MSLKDVKLFFEKVQEDETIQNKLKSMQIDHQEKMHENIVKLGAELGYDFDKEDMLNFVKERISTDQTNDELSDDQLDAVAGGSPAAWGIFSAITFAIACIASGIDKEIGMEC